MIWVCAAIALAAAGGCGVHFHYLATGVLTGRAFVYDYSPAAMQTGDVLQLWWCGWDDNSTDRTQVSDSIQYESFHLSNNAHYGPVPVLAESQYAWDGAYTCNPKVIKGSFVNPLGNGKTYSYAMYYVATDLVQGTNNRIGVAFSNNGRNWAKYPHPVISPESQTGYGVGQPAVYNTDHGAAIRMFYEDNTIGIWKHFAAISSDGVHFVKQGELTSSGLDTNYPPPTWGDMAYDTQTGYWYAAFNLPVRQIWTTGGFLERGEYGIQLYRIPDSSLFTGTTPWELLTVIDTALTGYESNFIASFLRDPYGNVNVPPYPPDLQMFLSVSNPRPPWNASPLGAGESSDIGTWDISTVKWERDAPLRSLNRYFNQTTYEVTTGWIDPTGDFTLQTTLGHLYQGPQQGAVVPFFSCKSGSTDYFVSVDPGCAGARIVGTLGYGYAKPVAGVNLVALYRCSVGGSDFVSTDQRCEAKANGQLLGYALP